jgi:hypothetical protein
MDERVLTKNPDSSKSGVNISRLKYDIVHAAVVETLRQHKEVTMAELMESTNQMLEGSFDGSISWYTTAVKLDMEAKGEVERVPKAKPQKIRLASG